MSGENKMQGVEREGVGAGLILSVPFWELEITLG